MDDELERRIAENEVRFRDMNERRRREESEFRDTASDELVVMCECSAVSCTLEFELSRDAYVDVRRDPRCFVLRAGHEVPEFERVVRDLGDDRLVVRKLGVGAEVAEASS